MTTTLNAATAGAGGLISTADASGVLQLQTAGTAALTINGSQNVGIGTSSPNEKLEVANAGGTVSIRLTGGDSNSQQVKFYSATQQNAALYSYYNAGSPYFAFYNNGSERMRIDSSGNVGIGTSSPASKLEVAVANGGSVAVIPTTSTTSGVQSFAKIFGHTDNTSTRYVRLACVNEGSTDLNGLAFYTNSGTTNTERARIDSSGNLLVGKTALNDTTTGVQIAGSGATYPGRICATVANSTNATEGIVVYSSAAGAYRFYVSMDGKVNATNTTIAAISDQRLKENIRDLDDGLSSIMALQPRKFDWKAGKGADIKNVRGFIAQEFETVFPDLVDTWKDPAPEGEEPYKSVRADLIPTLVKAIQEQQALIQTLTERITALEAK